MRKFNYHLHSVWKFSLILFIAASLNGCVLNVGVYAIRKGIWNTREFIACHPQNITPPESKDITIDFGHDITMKFVWIEALGMWFGEKEVTVSDYDRYDSDDSQIGYIKTWPGYTPTFPADNIQAVGAAEFCRFLNRHIHFPSSSRYEFRLPSEHEWETAARCGDQRLYPWGNDWPPQIMTDGRRPNVNGEDHFSPLDDRVASLFVRHPGSQWIKNFQDGHVGPCPVEESGRNEYGLYGLAGNESEWCRRDDGTYVLKGGYWHTFLPDDLKISSSEIIEDRPWPFFPLLKDRKSHYGTGFRVVIGKQ